MLLSFNALQYALYKDKHIQENYQRREEKEESTLFKAAMVLLILELVVLYFALTMAFRVGKTKKQTFIHVLMALLFTLPYVFYNVVFDTPAYQTLGN
jgi:glucan phosphoethanolaminetransferase (alkaline phosphatase superfamily)